MYDILNILYVHLTENDIENIYIQNVKEEDLYNYTLHLLTLRDVEHIQTFYDTETESKIATVEIEIYDTNRKNLVKAVKKMKKLFRNLHIKREEEELKDIEVESAYLENEVHDSEIVKKDLFEYRTILIYQLFLNDKS